MGIDGRFIPAITYQQSFTFVKAENLFKRVWKSNLPPCRRQTMILESLKKQINRPTHFTRFSLALL